GRFFVNTLLAFAAVLRLFPSRARLKWGTRNRISTLIIRVKWRLSIWWHRPAVGFSDVRLHCASLAKRTKPMRSVKSLIAAGAVSLLASGAFAADLPIAAPPMYAPPPPAEFGGWYLRGDIGMTNQQMKSLNNPDPNAVLFSSVGMGFDSSMLFDLGVGYQFNNWFRADVTAQWRG